MDTIENVCKELERIVADINSKGVGNIDEALFLNVEKLSASAETLGMKSGKKLIDNLSTVLQAFRDGKSEERSVSVRITALDFYIQNVLSSQGIVEDI